MHPRLARRLVDAESMSRCLRLPAALALALVLARPTHALAETKAGSLELPATADDEKLYSCAKAKGAFRLNLKPETEVRELITWMMSITCKTITFDSRFVTGRKVSIFSPKEVTSAEAYQIFLAALATVNLAIVPRGPSTYEVVEASAARKGTVPILKQIPAASGEMARYVYRPAYAQAETLRQAFGAVKSDAGDIQTIGTVLLLTDYVTNLNQMMTLARQVDVPGGTDGVYTIPVKHADAAKLAQKLEGFLGVSAAAAVAPGRPRPEAGGPAAAVAEATAVPSKIMVDDRTNTIVLASSEAAYLRVKALVDRLDIPLEIEGGAAFHVYRLSSAIAEELAATLNQAIQGQAQAQAQAGGKPGGAAPPAPPAPVPGDLGAQLEGPVRVIGDKPSNSLIVMSSGRDFLAMRSVIRELDLPRRQVYIEAMILEVAVGNDLALGASSHGALPAGGGHLLGSLQTGSASTLDPSSLASPGLVAGVLGKAITLFGQSVPSYGVLIQAVADTSHLNVLSAPSIIALDNEEAKYKVGVNIPVKRGTFTGLGGADSPANSQLDTFDRRDLTLQLAIKPHISTDDNLLLEVKHEAEELQGKSEGQPIWSTRAIDTRVVVRDQQTVVIGGLMQEREHTTVRKVPVLGDIPLLGHLFKNTQRQKRKTNLVIMLTPYIVKDQLELQAIRERKLREATEFTRSVRGLAAMEYQPRMDYARKRGLVEDINRTVADIEADVAARDKLRPPPSVLPGVVETPAREP